MAIDIKKIRALIGDDQIDPAIKELMVCLDEREDADDLQDQCILLKSRWADYKKKSIGGFADDREANSIRSALLDLSRSLETRLKEGKKDAHKTVEPKIKEPETPLSQPKYVAQCFFNGDVNQYYLLENNAIVAINPMSMQPIPVASRMPSSYPNVAWVYQFPNGMYYTIDHNGAIWGVNAFGLPMQMGYVKYY